MINSKLHRVKAHLELKQFQQSCFVRPHRTMAQFACEEIILPPGGPTPNRPFNLERQPWSKLWFELVESGDFCRFAVVGPTQTGKTLTCYVIPAMYYLFEIQENVGCGIPQMEMAWDKWARDFLPVIKASKYADQIPSTGQGSKGGKFESITFRNGATLKFMSAKGGDEKRSGITLRVLVITEIDKFDEASEGSREGDPVTQMIARLDAYETLRSLVFMECTASLPTGRIWREYMGGSASKIAVQCPYCKARVTPEREHLKGHQRADNEIDARDWAHFVCPACNEAWTEADRESANRNAVLVHRGQHVDENGTIAGPKPKTLTAGFRWTSANSLLRPAADIGGREFKARTDPDDENSEKAMQQFVWAMPWSGDTSGLGITEEIVATKLNGIERGFIPDDFETLVCQVDIHTKWHYWTIMATSAGNVRSIVDYGIWWNPDRTVVGNEEAIRRGLEDLADDLDDRQYVTDQGRIITDGLDVRFVDGGYHQNIGTQFVTERGSGWRLIKGEGRSDSRTSSKYHHPPKRTHDLRPGDHWCDRRQTAVSESNNQKWWMLFSDTDYWMHQVHGGFMAETFLEDGKTRRPGSLALFGSDPAIHLKNIDATIVRSSIAAQMVGWVWRANVTKRGQKIGWEAQWSQDHLLDTTYGCHVADSVVRAYHPRFKRPAPKADVSTQRFGMPDGRPYFLTER